MRKGRERRYSIDTQVFACWIIWHLLKDWQFSHASNLLTESRAHSFYATSEIRCEINNPSPVYKKKMQSLMLLFPLRRRVITRRLCFRAWNLNFTILNHFGAHNNKLSTEPLFTYYDVCTAGTSEDLANNIHAAQIINIKSQGWQLLYTLNVSPLSLVYSDAMSAIAKIQSKFNEN